MNRIVILGGGWGGLAVARALRFVDAQVTLVDRRESHLVPSRLYRAAVSQVRNLQVPFSRVLSGQKNIQVLPGEAVYLDARKRRLVLADRALQYDSLVVATGSRPLYERDAWQTIAPSLQSAEDAGRVREKLADRDTAVVVVGHPDIFVIGDLARVLHDGTPLNGLATVAAQQGRYVASAIRERMAGYDARPFDYVDQGRFAIIGRGGIGVLGDTQLRGTGAWLASRLSQNLLRPFLYSAATGANT